jgi:hypothetical protein
MRHHKPSPQTPTDTVSMQSAPSLTTLVYHLERRRADGWTPCAVTHNPDGSVTALLLRDASQEFEDRRMTMVPRRFPSGRDG